MRKHPSFLPALFGAALAAATVSGAGQAASAAVAPTQSPAATAAPAETPQLPPAMVAGVAADQGITREAAETLLLQQDKAHRVAASIPASLAAQEAGRWFEPATGKLTLAFTSTAAANRAKQLGADATVVGRSANQLAGVKDSVQRMVGSGIPGVYGWGIDVKNNDIVVDVNSATSTAATLAFLRDVRGLDGVRVVTTATSPRPQAGGTLHTGDPWWPGSESNCSVGFNVTDSSGAKNFLTAGHCTNDVNQTVYGASGQTNKIGTSNVGGTHSVNGQEGDMGLVSITEASWKQTADVNTWGEPAVTVSGSVDALVGDAVCHSGNTSHWKCGTVKYTHKDVDYGGGLIIGDLTWTDACSLGGDSGGGWLVGTKAAGLHDGGPSKCVSNPSDGDMSIFQPVNEALKKWNVKLVTGGGGGNDTTAPSAPGKPSVTGTTSSSVSLSWAASTDDTGVTGYDVYRGTAKVASATTTSATVTGLTADTDYTFTVKAKDAAGNVSAASAAVTAHTTKGGGGTDDEAPTTPGKPHSTTITANAVTLAWDASVDNVGVSGYDVLKGGAVATSVAGTATSATISGLKADTDYSLSVRAKDAAGNQSKATVAITVHTKPGGSTGHTFTSTKSYPIKDNARIYSPVDVTLTGNAAASVTLSVSINHTCSEDLGIGLVDPDGNVYPVKYSGDGPDCTKWSGARKFTVTDVDSSAKGQWMLRVTDYGPGDTGTLTGWSITL